MVRICASIVCVALLTACSGEPPESTGRMTEATGRTTEALASAPIRFIAVGDTGKGNDGQVAVARAMERKCRESGCDFVWLLGDNIYNSGVSSVTDPAWNKLFERPYAAIQLPFYAVLGNHDYGLLSYQASRGMNEVAYTKVSSKWKMPDAHYSFVRQNTAFIGLDTESVRVGSTENGDQTAWYRRTKGELRAPGVDWVIAAGHHPYRSNGPHGNAGSYDGMTFSSNASGAKVKSFFDDEVCGSVDVYLSGHDHSRQWLKNTLCGAELIVSGAGATTTDIARTDNPVHFQDDSELGFLYVVIDGRRLTGQFVDARGNVNFERTITKTSPQTRGAADPMAPATTSTGAGAQDRALED